MIISIGGLGRTTVGSLVDSCDGPDVRFRSSCPVLSKPGLASAWGVITAATFSEVAFEVRKTVIPPTKRTKPKIPRAGRVSGFRPLVGRFLLFSPMWRKCSGIFDESGVFRGAPSHSNTIVSIATVVESPKWGRWPRRGKDFLYRELLARPPELVLSSNAISGPKVSTGSHEYRVSSTNPWLANFSDQGFW